MSTETKMIVTDYEGNVIEFTGTKYQALYQGYNVNCTNCRHCTSCENCENCKYCNKCRKCSSCSECSRCTACTRCSGCSDCCNVEGCNYCIRCDYCSGCNNCSCCRRCMNCSAISNAADCPKQPVLTLYTDIYDITVCKVYVDPDDGNNNHEKFVVKIGCERYDWDDWLVFDEPTIYDMDGEDSVNWWKQWKPLLITIINTIPINTPDPLTL